MSIESRRQAGLSLVELVVSIAIVGVGVAGILGVMNLVTRHSADPVVQKQVLAIAESTLEEVELMAFTYCDPSDANFATAANAAGCATYPEDNLGAQPVAGLARQTFNNVGNYNGFAMNNGIQDITGAAIPGLAGYRVAVAIAQQAPGSNPAAPLAIPAVDSLLVTVTATGPGGAQVVLQGYRLRYAPNAGP